ncbi:hypothetical protein [Streptomyces sp. NPDC096323]|uniref:hypothetical protein n=1 Tax=Streptomyces sp. NPDC096323 TaxID=3155822 RepID=UPI00332AF560
MMPLPRPWSPEGCYCWTVGGSRTWEVYGSSEHPKLFVFIGDPDSWDLYALRRRGVSPDH